jgi:hypothetical protein
MQWLIRFLVGGTVVSVFSLAGDVLRPKGFAGLFAAAPSVALATLGLTVLTQGASYAALEARSMILGALALVIYAVGCVYLMARRHVRAATSSFGLLWVWAGLALTLRCVLL